MGNDKKEVLRKKFNEAIAAYQCDEITILELDAIIKAIVDEI